MSKDFTFKQFHINAFNCGMPVSTDAILLGAWANIESAHSLLDIGTGTGLLSIMAAQRNLSLNITAIEIEENAFNAAKQNIHRCPWADRLSVHHLSVKRFVELGETFDSIICNPPYFNDGETSSNKLRAVARHTNSLSHADLLIFCEGLLKQKGGASFVLPKKEGEAFINKIKENMYLQLSKLTHVKTTINKQPTRLLIEITKCIEPLTTIIDELTIHDGNHYSADFIALTQAFYLKM